MKQQILKALTMLTMILALALATAVVSANAQTSSRQLRASVPFDFIVGDKTMTAGQINVRRSTQESDAGFTISHADSYRSAMRLTNSIKAAAVPQQSKLVFHRYGNTYYLAQIWTAGDTEGRQLLKSKDERALERKLAAQELASTVRKETVTIVASLQ